MLPHGFKSPGPQKLKKGLKGSELPS